MELADTLDLESSAKRMGVRPSPGPPSMKYTVELEVSEQAVTNDPDLLSFVNGIQLMLNRMMHSFYKHPYLNARFPDNVDALGCLKARLKHYEETGNQEMLIDCANYAMIEFVLPSHPNAHFKPLSPEEAPDTVWRT